MFSKRNHKIIIMSCQKSYKINLTKFHTLYLIFLVELLYEILLKGIEENFLIKF